MGIKGTDELKAALERVRDGGKLRKSERVEALEHLELYNSISAAQAARLLGVSVRTIRSDRAALRRRYQEALKDADLLGELYRQWRISLERIDMAIEERDYKRVKALAQRWGVCEGFIKIAVPYQLDELAKLVEKAKLKLNGGE